MAARSWLAVLVPAAILLPWTILVISPPSGPPAGNRGFPVAPRPDTGMVSTRGSPRASLTSPDFPAISGRWTQRSEAPPSAGLVAPDLATGDVVSFGGWTGSPASQATNETWVLSGGVWGNDSGAGGPSSGIFLAGAMAADPPAGGVLLVGNPAVLTTPNQVPLQTWLFRNGNWSQLAPPQAPPTRLSFSLSWDPATRSVILFGGISSATYALLNDTWSFANDTWSNVTTAHAPTPRASAGLTYDAPDHELVLFGGNGPVPCSPSCSGAFEDTWTYSNGNWSSLSVILPGYDDSAPSLVAPPDSGPVLLDNGYGTWFFSSGRWTPLGLSEASYRSTLVFWPEYHGILSLGGSTWDSVLVNGNWSMVGLTVGWGFSIAWDPTDGYPIAFGSAVSGTPPITLRFDGRLWRPISTVGAPPYAGPVTSDPAEGGVLMYGGWNDTSRSCLSYTWLYRSETWTELNSTAPAPDCEYDVPMAYDPALQGVVRVEATSQGIDWAKAPAETLLFRGHSWAVLPRAYLPVNLSYSSRALLSDPNDGWLILLTGPFGLAAGTWSTWVFNGTGWIQLSPSPELSERAGEATGFAPSLGAPLIFGGETCTSCVLNDTWSFVGGAWLPVQAFGPSPPPIAGGTLIADPASGLLELFGGQVFMCSPPGSVYCTSGATSQFDYELSLTPPALRPNAVIFEETGLPPGAYWGMSSGAARTFTNNSSASVSVLPGSYQFGVQAPYGYTGPSAVTIVVANDSVTYLTVHFEEQPAVPLGLWVGLGVAGGIGAGIAVWVVPRLRARVR